MKKLIIVIVFLNSILVFCQNKAEKTIWKTYSEKVNNGYLIQFKYPAYFKFDRIENCLCLGSPSVNEEYNNTMDWGIWMDEPQNYTELDIEYFKEEFKNDFIIKKDTVMLSKFKAFKTLVTQSHGGKYYESIVLKFNDCIIEVINRKGKSDDFKIFYNSIIITP